MLGEHGDDGKQARIAAPCSDCRKEGFFSGKKERSND